MQSWQIAQTAAMPTRAPATLPPLTGPYKVSQALMLVALIGLLYFHLLGALLGGLLVYLLVEMGARGLERMGIIPRRGRIILLILIAAVVCTLLTVGGLALGAQMSNGQDNYVRMLQLMADTVERARTWLPQAYIAYLPDNIDELQKSASEWLREHAGQFGKFGQQAVVGFVHVLLGLIIGGMVAVAHRRHPRDRKALAAAMVDRLDVMSVAFRNIVFSQIRISALNTVLTGIFLVAILPIFGYQLPFTKTLIAVTFFAGLLPIIGNLISNTVITIVALSVALPAAVSALAFLVIIHKLEYFFNAHIIGSRIKAQAWEVLSAMIVMEAIFGIAGVIAAPIFYAYIKDELTAQKLI